MGLGIGTNCCSCIGERIWRFELVGTADRYHKPTPTFDSSANNLEAQVVGTVDGFDYILPTGQLKLENTGGTNWSLLYSLSGITRQVKTFSHTFAVDGTPIDITLDDYSFDDHWASRPIITIGFYTDPKPAEWHRVPNRLGDLEWITALKPGSSPVTLTRSTDATYVYYTGTIDLVKVWLRINKETRVIEGDFTDSGLSSPSYDKPVIRDSNSPVSWRLSNVHQIYEAAFVPLVERIKIDDFMIENETIEILRTEFNLKRFNSVSPLIGRGLDYFQTKNAPDEFVDSTLLETTAPTGYFVVSQTMRLGFYDTARKNIFGIFNAVVSNGVSTQNLTSNIFVETYDAMTGVASFNLIVRNNSTTIEVNAPFTGTITFDDEPSSEWDMDDAEKRAVRVFMPKFVTAPVTGVIPSVGYDWSFMSGSPLTRIPCYMRFIGQALFSLPTVTVVEGSLPPGFAIQLTGTSGVAQSLEPFRLVGVAPAGAAAGTVRFQVNVPGLWDEPIRTPLYRWQVDGGLIELELYPSPYTTSATPPDPGFDWRIGVIDTVSISAIGSWPDHTFSVHSGSLPPSCVIDSSTGEIFTPSPAPIGFPTTGSVVIKIVDNVTLAEQFSREYDWQYV
jgi:hypothetical protein